MGGRDKQLGDLPPHPEPSGIIGVTRGSVGWGASRRLLWGSLALLQGPRNSILTISVPEPSGRPAGLWCKCWFIYSVSQQSTRPWLLVHKFGNMALGQGTVQGGGPGRSFLEALRHIPGDSHAVLPLQKGKQSQFSVKPAIFSCRSQPHPGSHFPGGQISQESFLCQGEKTRKPSQSAVIPATCDVLNDRATGTLQMDEG